MVDAPHKDLRRARSAMLSLAPTTTGSATAIALIYPELKGKHNGHAVRAPLLNASLTDCVFELKRETRADEVNRLFAAAAKGPLAGILGYEERPLVSADYARDTRSGIVDALSTILYASAWNFTMVSGFAAAWTIGYGVVQALAPALVRRSEDGLNTEVPAARRWSVLLALIPMGLPGLVAMKVPNLQWVVVAGLGLFGFAFAVNSSVHSYLILAYAGSEKTAEDVGFYYAANALGRFFGTLLSGLLYQWGGLLFSLGGSAAMLVTCWLISLALPVTAPGRQTGALPTGDANLKLVPGATTMVQALPADRSR